ncbi:MAG: PAS domain-containing protein [Myxococcota bacterium]
MAKELEGDLEATLAFAERAKRDGRLRIQRALDSLNRSFGTEIAIVSHIVGDTYTVLHASAPEGTIAPGDVFELGTTYCALTVRSDKVLAIDDMGASEYAGHPCYAERGLESYLGVPIQVNGAAFGTISFSSPAARSVAWTESDVVSVTMIAEWTSMLLERDALDERLLSALRAQRLVERTRRIGSWRTRLGEETVEWSDQTYAIHKVAPGEPIPLSEAIDYYVEDDRPIIEKYVGEGKPWDAELRIRTASGRERWVRAIGEPVMVEGELVELHGIFEDIDDRKRLEERLTAENVRFEQIAKELKEVSLRHGLALRASEIGLWDWDVVADHLVWDDQMYRLYGIDRASFSSAYEAWVNGVHPEDREASMEAVERALAGEQEFRVQFRALSASGEVRHIRAIAEVLRNDAGRPTLMAGANWDVSEHHEQLQQLRRANAELEQFTYFASHDLRAPVRHITSFLDLLRETLNERINDEEREWMDFAFEGAKRMDRLISDLLAYSRAGKQTLQFSAVDLREVVAETAEMLRTGRDAEETLQLVIGELPTLRASRWQIELLVQNLLENAIRYRKPGHAPKVRVTAEETRTHWRVSVADEGIGIDPQFHARILEPFQRLAEHDNASTGIGLAICSKIAVRHGGELSVASEPGQGATFSFRISKALRAVESVRPAPNG